MSCKNKIIIIGGLLIILIIFSMIYFLMPTINIDIKGEKNLILNIGEDYEELGANAYIKKIFKQEKIKVKTVGSVDTKKIGKYIVSYEVLTEWGSKEAIRIVNVVDNENPVIKLNKDLRYCKNNNLLEIDATADDNYDGNISENIKYKVEKDKVILSVSDSSNNETILEEKIKYIDSEKPIITLNGSSIIYLNVGDEYQESGAEAYDSCDGNITKNVKIIENIDINKKGEYQVTYEVKDSLGNKTSITRQVFVVDKDELIEYPIINGATIYLTFDDGPYKYTEDILEILKKYDIKATFFVTNQFPKYQYVIKKEYEQGHTIGIHTYSHKWSIYESVDAYLEDFNKIDEIVYKETGMHTKIFRFPGGSSNKVSRNYKKGIMTELSEYMTEQGYIYFDWNVDSGDTSKKDSSTKAIIKNVKSNLKGDGNYIILMHDIKANTLEALPEIIEYALARGYEFKALNENSPVTHFKIAN